MKLFSASVLAWVLITFALISGPNLVCQDRTRLDVVSAGSTAIEIVKTTDDPDAKWRAIRILGGLRYEPAVPLLLEALSDSHRYVRSNAARALGDIGAASAVKPLIELLANERDGGVIEQTSLALANLAAKEALPVLKHAALHEDPQTRAWVLQAIGRLGDKCDVSFLARYLDDPSFHVPEVAAQAIEQILGVNFRLPRHEGLVNSGPAILRAKAWWKENKHLFPDP